jgi:hypothetical protein
LVGLLVVAALAAALVWLFGGAGQAPRVGQEAAPTETPLVERRAVPTDTPLPGRQMVPTDVPPTATLAPTPSLEPYPPPPIQPTPMPIPTVVTTTATALPSLPDTPPVPGKAATLHNGNVWLVEQGHVPEAVTDVGDVAAIFGWNWDGTKLLLGRGRHVLGGDIGDTTELWVLDVASRQSKQLTTSNLVAAASWSPVDDRIAYCERGDVLTVATLEATVLHQLKSVGCSFTWSPDGSVVAIETYTPDMITDDGLKYSVLAVWWLSNEKLQVFSDAKDEAQYWPVWSTDGSRILFQRDYYEPSKQDENGWHVVEVTSGLIRRLDNTPVSAEEIRRSPQADQVAYRVGPDLYVMDFEGRIDLVTPGHSPIWAPDGKTLFYRGTDNGFQVIAIETDVTGHTVGGAWPSPGLYIRPEYFFAPGEGS